MCWSSKSINNFISLQIETSTLMQQETKMERLLGQTVQLKNSINIPIGKKESPIILVVPKIAHKIAKKNVLHLLECIPTSLSGLTFHVHHNYGLFVHMNQTMLLTVQTIILNIHVSKESITIQQSI